MGILKKLFALKGTGSPPTAGKACHLCGKTNPLEVKFCFFCGGSFQVVSDTFDAFISYRRETASELASLLKFQLENRFNRRVFLDINELQVGRFDEELLRRIEKTPNFIVILSRASLDRCVNKSDWLKREIMHALETSRNIIPVFTENFSFPSDEVWALLPPEMEILPSLNGVIYSHIHQDSAVSKIASYMKTEVEVSPIRVFLTPEPTEQPSPNKTTSKPERKASLAGFNRPLVEKKSVDAIQPSGEMPQNAIDSIVALPALGTKLDPPAIFASTSPESAKSAPMFYPRLSESISDSFVIQSIIKPGEIRFNTLGTASLTVASRFSSPKKADKSAKKADTSPANFGPASLRVIETYQSPASCSDKFSASNSDYINPQLGAAQIRITKGIVNV